MKDSIVNYLDKNDKAKDIKEISKSLNEINLEEIQNTLDSLVQEGIVHETRKHKYILMKYCKSLHTGTIDVAKNGYAFLIQNNGMEDIFISKDNLNGAINGDTALVDLYLRNGRLEGKVIKILNRGIKNVVGEILYVGSIPTLILDDKKLDIEVKLENHFNNLVDGHKVLVELTEQIDDKVFNGVIKKIIGHKNDPGIDILTIAYKH